jgi:hypothetical protein
MNTPDISDFNDSDNDMLDNDPTLSDNDYICDGESNEDDNISIDMDEKPKTYSNKILGKLILKPKITPAPTPTPTAIPIPIETVKSKPKLTITKKTVVSSNTDSIESIPKKDSNSKKDNIKEEAMLEENKLDSQFEINEQTIDFWSRDIDLKKHCCKKSPCKNDLGVLCLMIKLGYFKDYRCNIKKCRVGKSWYNKPIQLILNRKNNVMDDLTPSNLELLCPNCYMCIHGVELFNKVINHTIFKCKICNYPLTNFSNAKKKTGFCISCENKIINSSFDSKQYEYIQELKKTTHEQTSQDNKYIHDTDDFQNTNYYNEISQFKSFKHHDKDNTKPNLSNKFDNKPIINLNMSVPDLEQLLGDEF